MVPEVLHERLVGCEGASPNLTGARLGLNRQEHLFLVVELRLAEQRRQPGFPFDLDDERPEPGLCGGQCHRGRHRRLADPALPGNDGHPWCSEELRRIHFSPSEAVGCAG